MKDIQALMLTVVVFVLAMLAVRAIGNRRSPQNNDKFEATQNSQPIVNELAQQLAGMFG